VGVEKKETALRRVGELEKEMKMNGFAEVSAMELEMVDGGIDFVEICHVIVVGAGGVVGGAIGSAGGPVGTGLGAIAGGAAAEVIWQWAMGK